MLTLLPLVLFLLLILWIFVFPAKRAAASATDAEVASGVQWLQEQEAHSPDDVEAELKAIRQAELDAMRDEWRAKLYSGEISVWSLFEDYAMLGDSRTSGFTYYGYLAPERVFADSGATIKKVIDHLEELVALNPSIIFLTYGINDVGIGYWPTPEDYVNEINNTLALLKEHLPNATVYVCSIIPALEPAFKRGPAWREIRTTTTPCAPFARKMAHRTWTLRSSAKNTRIFIRTTACTCWAAFTRFGVPN